LPEEIVKLFNELNSWDLHKEKNCNSIEQFKIELLQNKKIIEKQEFGAGSRILSLKKNSIKSQTLSSSCTRTLGKILYNLSEYLNESKVLELGTHFGIGTAYLSKPNTSIKVTSIEACPTTLNIATNFLQKQTFSHKLQLINGTFNDVLADLNNKKQKFNLFYIDGDHKGESLSKYFTFCRNNLATEKSVFIIDDINWSKDMFHSWNKIIKDNEACSINAGRFGIIIFNEQLPANSYMLKFSKPSV
jgi:predicted O-methyltransferase YrrM